MKKQFANIKFCDNHRYYELGDTITVYLDNGTKAIYTLTELKKVKNGKAR